jgi:sarcosine oxidase
VDCYVEPVRASRTDTVIVGAGVFGLATAIELAKRGQRVTIIDRLGIGHAAASSTGASRSIRVAYSHPLYVDLALDAIARWKSLELASHRTILHLTGQVDLGPEPVIEALIKSTAAAGASVERSSNRQLRALLPELSDERAGLFQAQAGTVMAAEGLDAMRLAATDAGVEMLMPERVVAIDAGEPAVVHTTQRELSADSVVVAAGPWTGGLLEPLGISLRLAPSVAQVTFLDAPDMVGRPGIAAWPEPGGVGIYGHPVPGVGYKLAFDAGAEGWDADTEEWSPDAAEESRLLEWMRHHLAGAPRDVAYSQRHPWTMTPDSDFVVDRRGSVVLACGCSGHAFKFGPALGPLVADVVEGNASKDLFSLNRPGLQDEVAATKAIGR